MISNVSDSKLQFERRAFLAASGVLLAAVGTRSAAQQPPLRTDALEAWEAAATLPLWPGKPPGGAFSPRPLNAKFPPYFLRNIASPYLKVFLPAQTNGRSLLIIPGGSYTFVSIANEGVDVAKRMAALGYTAFVLAYRLPDEGWISRADVPLQDAQRAMRVVRAQASRYQLDPGKAYAVGFSAGGHLAASLATGYAEPVYGPVDAFDRLDARPRAVGLIYPVISHEAGIGHADSSLKLLGPNPDAAVIARRSPALHVTAGTPPAFFVHALNDRAVSYENSLIMMKAMQAMQRPVEVHLFESGGHGFGLGRPETPAGHWLDLFGSWLDSVDARPVS